MATATQKPRHTKPHARGLMTIAAYHLIKSALLIALGFGELHYLHRDLAHEVAHWVDLLRVDPHNHYITWLLERVANVNPHRLKELSAGTFFYAALAFCEGTGLALRMRWAEYLTVVTTASLLPIEVYELFLRPDWPRVLILLVNIACVVYLVWILREGRKKHTGSH
jgi:uncharacterized membrane protein (DUF2068 family)